MIATAGFITVALIFQMCGSALSYDAGQRELRGVRADPGILVALVALACAFAAGWLSA